MRHARRRTGGDEAGGPALRLAQRGTGRSVVRGWTVRQALLVAGGGAVRATIHYPAMG